MWLILQLISLSGRRHRLLHRLQVLVLVHAAEVLGAYVYFHVIAAVGTVRAIRALEGFVVSVGD